MNNSYIIRHVPTAICLAVMLVQVMPGHSQHSIAALRAKLENATAIKEKADLSFEISNSYRRLLKVDSAIFFANKVKDYSEPANYTTGIGMAHVAMAEALNLRGHNSDAENHLIEALQIFSGAREKSLLGKTYLSLANTRFLMEKADMARNDCYLAIFYSKSAGDIEALNGEYWLMGRSYYKTYETDSASFYFIRALAMAEQSKDANRVYLAALWLGRTFLSISDWQMASKYFAQSIERRPPHVDKVGYRALLRDYAVCLARQHQYSTFEKVLMQIEELNNSFKDAYGYVITDRLRGSFAYEKGDFISASEHLGTAYNRITNLGISNSETKDILLLLGSSEFKTGLYDSAIIHLKTAAQLSRELRQKTDEEAVNLLISKSFDRKGKADSALVYFQSYAAIRDTILTEQKQKTIIEVTARYETEKKEQLIRILEKEKLADAYLIALRTQELQKQKLEGEKKTQQLQLVSQQSEINRLEALQKSMALQNQQQQMAKKQHELDLVSRESELQATIATKESQKKEIAYIAAIAVLILGAAAFYRYRQSRKLSKQLAASLASLKQAQDQLIQTEKEKEAENVRVRISRDIHDEVGATLSGVALFSEIAKQKMDSRQEEDARNYLNHISANSKEMVEKMSDIVWAINPDNDSFDRIISKLQSFAFNLCAGRGIRFHLEADEAIRAYHPPMNMKKNIYLLLKEAINNAVKYSAAKNISVSLHAKGDNIEAAVADDGKGFDIARVQAGNGLSNMRARAGNLQGTINIISDEGRGTTIRVAFHFNPAGIHPAGGYGQNV